MPEQALPDE